MDEAVEKRLRGRLGPLILPGNVVPLRVEANKNTARMFRANRCLIAQTFGPDWAGTGREQEVHLPLERQNPAAWSVVKHGETENCE